MWPALVRTAHLVTASDDNTARIWIWDGETSKPVGEPLRHEGAVNSVSFSADSTRIVTASDDKTARIWDANTGRPVSEPMPQGTGYCGQLQRRRCPVSPRRRTKRCGSGTRTPANRWAGHWAMGAGFAQQPSSLAARALSPRRRTVRHESGIRTPASRWANCWASAPQFVRPASVRTASALSPRRKTTPRRSGTGKLASR